MAAKQLNAARVVHSTLTLRAAVIEAARRYAAAYNASDDAAFQVAEQRLLDAVDRLEAAERDPPGLETKMRRLAGRCGRVCGAAI